VELKNGETYNGHLVNCDTWMNIHLREVICTSKVQVFLFIYLILGVFVF
jgi:small nuclear ribonucleoprotein (snRNP)-like protein